MRLTIIAILIGIVLSLVFAFKTIIRPGGNSGRLMRALSLRISLSICLFLLLLLAWRLGLIAPHGING
jgi:hypothetical protein